MKRKFALIAVGLISAASLGWLYFYGPHAGIPHGAAPTTQAALTSIPTLAVLTTEMPAQMGRVVIPNTPIIDRQRDGISDDIKKIMTERGVQFGPGFPDSDKTLQAVTNAYGAVTNTRFPDADGNAIDIAAVDLVMDHGGWDLVPRTNTGLIVMAEGSSYPVQYEPGSNLKVINSEYHYKAIQGTENAMAGIGEDGLLQILENVVEVNGEKLGLKILSQESKAFDWNKDALVTFFESEIKGVKGELTIGEGNIPHIGDYQLTDGNEWVKELPAVKFGDQYEKIGDKFVYTNPETGAKLDVPIVVAGENARITLADGTVVEQPASSINYLELKGRPDILAVWGADGKAAYFYSDIRHEMVKTWEIQFDYKDIQNLTKITMDQVEHGDVARNELLNGKVAFPGTAKARGIVTGLTSVVDNIYLNLFFKFDDMNKPDEWPIRVGGYYELQDSEGKGRPGRAVHILNPDGSEGVVYASTWLDLFRENNHLGDVSRNYWLDKNSSWINRTFLTDKNSLGIIVLGVVTTEEGKSPELQKILRQGYGNEIANKLLDPNLVTEVAVWEKTGVMPIFFEKMALIDDPVVFDCYDAYINP